MACSDRGKQMLAVLHAQIRGPSKAVLFALDSIRGTRKRAWPSLETIAAASGVSRSAASRALSSLEAIGVLSSEHDRTEHRCYRVINYEKLLEMASTPQRLGAPSIDTCQGADADLPSPSATNGEAHSEARLGAHRALASPKKEPCKEDPISEHINEPIIDPGGRRGSHNSGWSLEDEKAIRKAYPLQTKPDSAIRAIRRVLYDGYPHARLLSDTLEYAAAVKGCNTQYLTSQDRWLEAGRFREDSETRKGWRLECRDGNGEAREQTAAEKIDAAMLEVEKRKAVSR